jgi:integrase
LDSDGVTAVARTVRDASLESRTARSRLKVRGKPYFKAIDPGLHLGYRKGKTGGKWVTRWYTGGQQYRVATIDGIADDTQDADGVAVLSYAQAQEKARALFVAAKRGGIDAGPLTVEQACNSYIEFLRAERKTADDAASRLGKHVYPKLGKRPVAALTTAEIEKTRNAMVRKDPDDPDAERRSKDSANKVMNYLRAALNRAYQDESNGIASSAAWDRVKSFNAVSRAREVHLDREQVKRLLNTTSGAFRNLLTAALLTGARPPHELVALRVRDLDIDHGSLAIIDGKTGGRVVPLSKEAVQFFAGLAAGRHPDALLLPKDDGKPWGKNHHVRPMREAVERAKLPADTTIYSLRHTHISDAVVSGMPLTILAENCGTSVRMIESNYAKAIAATRSRVVERYGYRLGLKANKKVQRISDRAKAAS